MMIHRRLLLVTLILLALPIAGCDQASVVTPEPTTIVIAGSTAMQPLLTALTEAFVQEHPNVLFDIRGGGSHLGEERLLRGEIDMAASTLLPAENSDVFDDLPVATYTPIGFDGLAVVVNQRNAIDELSIPQLRDLFGGRLLTWSALLPEDGDNGPNEDVEQEVVLVSREEGSGSRALFEEVVMGTDGVALTAVVMPSSADVIDFVSTHPNAIGYVSRAYLATVGENKTNGVLPADDVLAVSVEGVTPQNEDFIDEGYLLTHPIFLLTDGEQSGWARTFIDFVLSPTGQEIVDQYHARVR